MSTTNPTPSPATEISDDLLADLRDCVAECLSRAREETAPRKGRIGYYEDLLSRADDALARRAASQGTREGAAVCPECGGDMHFASRGKFFYCADSACPGTREAAPSRATGATPTETDHG